LSSDGHTSEEEKKKKEAHQNYQCVMVEVQKKEASGYTFNGMYPYG
jgi:hypothetical protein